MNSNDPTFIAIVERLQSYFISTFSTFSYFTKEDISQEVALLCLEALPSYKEVEGGTLYSFLSSHVRNRLYNLVRNKYKRYDTPCKKCPLGAFSGSCLRFSTPSTQCFLLQNWEARERARSEAASCGGEGPERFSEENGVSESRGEFFEWLDTSLSKEERREWATIKSGNYSNRKFSEFISKVKAKWQNNLGADE